MCLFRHRGFASAKLWSVLLMCFQWVSCTEPDVTTPQEPYQTSLLCFVVEGHSQQEVLLYRTTSVSDRAYNFYYPPGTFWSAQELYFIRDATVQLQNRAGTSYALHAVYDTSNGLRPRSYYTNSDSLILSPGEQFGAFIQVEDETITGKATIPGSFEILHPAAHDTLPREGLYDFRLDASWTRSSGAAGYLVIVSSVVVYDDSVSRRNIYSYQTFSTTDTSLSTRFSNIYGSGEHTLEVIAYDRNYYEHRFHDALRIGIEGPAYGFCAGGIARSIPVAIR
jgi:hypothetical protein